MNNSDVNFLEQQLLKGNMQSPPPTLNTFQIGQCCDNTSVIHLPLSEVGHQAIDGIDPTVITGETCSSGKKTSLVELPPSDESQWLIQPKENCSGVQGHGANFQIDKCSYAELVQRDLERHTSSAKGDYAHQSDFISPSIKAIKPLRWRKTQERSTKSLGSQGYFRNEDFCVASPGSPVSLGSDDDTYAEVDPIDEQRSSYAELVNQDFQHWSPRWHDKPCDTSPDLNANINCERVSFRVNMLEREELIQREEQRIL